MNYFTKLFTRAPFDYLQLHMEKVIACMVKLKEIFALLETGEGEKIQPIAEKVSEFEHEADLIKNDIRTSLPNSFLFPVDKSNFLEILSLQDSIADSAEDIAGYLMIKELKIFEEIREDFQKYVEKIFEATWDVKEIVFNLDQLLEASFGGPIAETTRAQIEQVAFKEHQADLIKQRLIKRIFQRSEQLKTADFFLWIRLVEEMGVLVHFAEKLALRIGMIVDFK